METSISAELIRRAVYDGALFSLVPLAICSLVGFCVSFIQAITQIQEQSLAITFKLSAAIVLVVLFWGRASQEFIGLVSESLAQIARVRAG